MTDFQKHPLHYSIYTRSCATDIFELIELNSCDKVLDVGCGIGYYIERLKQFDKNINLCGIEYDYKSLKYAKKRINVNFIQAEGTRIPFKDNAFDTILSVSVMEHIEDDENMVKEMVRVCKKGGQIIVSVPSKDGLRSFSKWRNMGHTDKTNPEYHFRIGYSKNELVNMLEKHGVCVEEVRYSLVLFAELFMDFVKWIYFKKNELESQTNITKSTTSPIFLFYKIFLPVILFVERTEKYILAKWLKGHIITARGRV